MSIKAIYGRIILAKPFGSEKKAAEANNAAADN